MPSYDYSLLNGVDAVAGFGDKWKMGFGGTWAFNDTWGFTLTTTQGDFRVGLGNLQALAPTTCFTFKNRLYLGLETQFNTSANYNPDIEIPAPMRWEVQDEDDGAGFFPFLSQYGGQDTVSAFGQLQGRLAVFGRQSVQIWQVDASPSEFQLLQALGNLGTRFPLSVWSLGDLDTLFLDDTGFRSLRARETTLNAYPDDIGSAVDNPVQQDLLDRSSIDPVVGVVEPVTKNYWCYLNKKIYVLARHLASKITAWSTYLPTFEELNLLLSSDIDPTHTVFGGLTVGNLYYFTKSGSANLTNGSETVSTTGYFVANSASVTAVGTGANSCTVASVDQTAFTPQKFVLLNGRVYCRSVEQGLLLYGGTDNQQYDNTVVTVEMPWLDDKAPATNKFSQGIDFALAGAWTISCGMNPPSGTLVEVIEHGDGTNPAENSDSSFDIGRIGFEQQGTHFKMKAVSASTSRAIAILSSLIFHYNKGTNKG